MGENVFTLWLQNGLNLPFFVRDKRWPENKAYLVTEISFPGRNDMFNFVYKGCLYGECFGYLFVDGIQRDDLYSSYNYGTYQYEIVDSYADFYAIDISSFLPLVRNFHGSCRFPRAKRK